MTENKRFRIVNEFGDYHIKDGDDELCYDLCSPSIAKENWNNVVNLLNELNDECEFLEIENESFEHSATLYAELYHKSLKENKELKQSNKDAWNLIQFIYNEIKEDGYMDWGRIQDLVEF